jgi:O-antigen ligase
MQTTSKAIIGQSRMPPQLATLFTFIFIIFLFLVDRKKVEGVSDAVWIPFIWILLVGSRFVSQWINLGAPLDTAAETYLEGSPLDRFVFLFLILAGAFTLYRRKLDWRELLRRNIWVVLFFVFGAVSILWSDYPFVSLKRWVKASGNLVMALVILTEKRPEEAFGVIMRRAGFLLLPLSVLFIKYYPHIGRTYHITGWQLFNGVSTTKNMLGQLCLIIGIYYAWDLLVNKRRVSNSGRKQHVSAYLLIGGLLAYLFYLSNSATSQLCMLVAFFILLVSQIPAIARKPGRIFVFGLGMISVFLVLEATIGLTRIIIVDFLGRDPSLTTRVPMWLGLIDMAGSPLIGVGYESFWLGRRLEVLWQMYGALHQAHNGYLEVYLNLGLIGLCLILAAVFSGVLRLQKQLKNKELYNFSILRLTYLMVVLLYNWTEASFYGVNNIWLLMYFSVIDLPARRYFFRVRNEQEETVVRPAMVHQKVYAHEL